MPKLLVGIERIFCIVDFEREVREGWSASSDVVMSKVVVNCFLYCATETGEHAWAASCGLVATAMVDELLAIATSP